MKARHFPQVSGNYRVYRTFLRAPKVTETPHLFGEISTCGREEVAVEPLAHPLRCGASILRVVVKLFGRHGYNIQMFCRTLDVKPLFRFDSSGEAHTNPEDGRGLAARRIPTPHFHQITEAGIEIAFRTRSLEDPSFEDAVANSYETGIRHFCQTAYVFGPDGQEPRMIRTTDTQPMLPIPPSNDPLEGVSFS